MEGLWERSSDGEGEEEEREGDVWAKVKDGLLFLG